MNPNHVFLAIGLLMLIDGILRGRTYFPGSNRTWVRAAHPWRYWGSIGFWAAYVLISILLDVSDPVIG